MPKKPVEVAIFNHKFTVKTDNPEDFVESVADYVNQTLETVKRQTKTATSIHIALLACLNIAEEYLKFREERGRMKKRHEKKIQELVELINLQL